MGLVDIIEPGEVLFRDRFEDTDFSEWNLGDSGDLSRVSSPVAEGSYAAELASLGNATHPLDSYTQISEFRIWWQHDSWNTQYSGEETRIVLTGDDSSGNGSDVAEIWADYDINELVLKTRNGDVTLYGSPSTNTWYEIRLYNFDWSNHVHDAEVRDINGTVVNSLSGVDFGGDAVNVKYFAPRLDDSGNDPTNYFDNVRLIG